MKVFPLAILGVAFALAYAIQGVFKLQSKKTAAAAKEMGFIITKVEREEMPVFGAGNKVDSFVKGSTTRYALPRAGAAGTNWELLQRDPAHGAQLPNGYLLKSAALTPELLETFRPIAEEFSEEYFEFEGTASDVAVYWEEWGGTSQLPRIHKTLSALRAV